MPPTHLRADFTLREVVPPPTDADWVPSPLPGVERHMLDRIGDEVARATTVVRYAPGSSFERHVHGGGEEFLVLEGTFSDEHGDCPAGFYVRNPPGTSHVPFSKDGCTILVKLWQFCAGDTEPVRLDTRSTPWRPGRVEGLSVMPLHSHDGIDTALVRWDPHTIFQTHAHPGGEEIYVIDGVFHDEHGAYPAGTWLRSPRWSTHTPFTGAEGATILVKVGHLDAPMLKLPGAAS